MTAKTSNYYLATSNQVAPALNTTYATTGGTSTLLSDTRIAGADANIDISGLATGYNELEIILDDFNVTTNADDVWLRFNNDSGANYGYAYIKSIAAVVTANDLQGQTKIVIGSSFANSVLGSFRINISNSATAFQKTGVAVGGSADNLVQTTVIRWVDTTNEITRVQISGSTSTLKIGTRCRIYGVT